MSSVATIRQPATLSSDWTDDSIWHERLARDRATADVNQSRAQKRITNTLLRRVIDANGAGFALTGSTARNRRTAISDLDFHVIGERPESRDLHDEIDVVAYDAPTLFEKLYSGDDYVQWTLRYGCILHDTGIFRQALTRISQERLWPRPDTKFTRLPGQIALARRLVEAGDQEGAQAEARATFTSAARAVLLRAGVFPLARSELPDQLRQLDLARLAEFLERTIYREVPLEELAHSLQAIESGGIAPLEVPPALSG